ncbi:hypothetical protein [Ottowia oryzae]
MPLDIVSILSKENFVKFRMIFTAALLIASTTCFAKGPVGIGKLEIGMSRTAIEGLAVDDGVHLNSPLTPYQNKYYEPKPGEDRFDTMLITPFSKDPLKSVLTFSDGILKSIYIDLGDSSRIVDQVKELITEKYGEPKVDNSMKEEQCIYKGGANFKISSGSIRNSWTQDRPNAEPISTSLSDTVIDTCPSTLRYAIGAMKSRSLTIGVAQPVKPVVNPF